MAVARVRGLDPPPFVVDDIHSEIARLSAAVRFRSEVVTGPGGSQGVLDDPAGSPIELFVPRRQ